LEVAGGRERQRTAAVQDLAERGKLRSMRALATMR